MIVVLVKSIADCIAVGLRWTTDRLNIVSHWQPAVSDNAEVAGLADDIDSWCQYFHVVDGESVNNVSWAKPQHLCHVSIQMQLARTRPRKFHVLQTARKLVNNVVNGANGRRGIDLQIILES